MFSIFRETRDTADIAWLNQILWAQIGLIRSKRQIDNTSELEEIITSTDDDAIVEKRIHHTMMKRICSQFPDKDMTVWLEVMYFRPPSPLVTLKLFVTEGDTIHPPVRARFNLEFGPEGD